MPKKSPTSTERSTLDSARFKPLADIPADVEWASIPRIARSLEISNATAWDWIRRGILPAPIRPTPGVTRLNVRLVRERMQKLQQEADAEAPDIFRYRACHAGRAKRGQRTEATAG